MNEQTDLQKENFAQSDLIARLEEEGKEMKAQINSLHTVIEKKDALIDGYVKLANEWKKFRRGL